MIELSGLNYGALAVAWLITVGIGSFWYSPAAFGKLWSKLSGVDMMKLPQNEANQAIGSVIVSSLIQVVTLGVLLNSLHVTKLSEGLVAALVMWFGLTAATTVGNNLYMRKSWKFWWLNASFFLVVMSINGCLLAVWR